MTLAAFLVRRLGLSLLVLLGVSAIVFFSLFLTGDPAALMLPPDASRAEIDAFRAGMGFNDPWLLQYLRYVGAALTGDSGVSLCFQQPVLSLIAERVPATALLAVTALAWSTLVASCSGPSPPSGVAASSISWCAPSRCPGRRSRPSGSACYSS